MPQPLASHGEVDAGGPGVSRRRIGRAEVERFDSDEWFQITAEDRKYLRALLLVDMGTHDFASDEYRRASRMNIILMERDAE